MLFPDLVNTIINRLNIDPHNIRGGLTYHLLFNYLDKLKNEVNLSAYAPPTYLINTALILNFHLMKIDHY